MAQATPASEMCDTLSTLPHHRLFIRKNALTTPAAWFCWKANGKTCFPSLFVLKIKVMALVSALQQRYKTSGQRPTLHPRLRRRKQRLEFESNFLKDLLIHEHGPHATMPRKACPSSRRVRPANESACLLYHLLGSADRHFWYAASQLVFPLVCGLGMSA